MTTPQVHHRTAPGFFPFLGEKTRHRRVLHGCARTGATSCAELINPPKSTAKTRLIVIQGDSIGPSLQKTVIRAWQPGSFGAVTAPRRGFFTSTRIVRAARMVPPMVDRVGTPQGVPVPKPGLPTLHGLPPLLLAGKDGRFTTCRFGASQMADTLTAPALGRTLRISAPSITAPSWASKPVHQFAPAWRRRLAYALADKARRRAELRARAFAVVLADQREGGAA